MVFAVLLMSFNDANAQRRNRRNAEPAPDPKAEVYNTIEWRSIGPYRGGRASTVSGVPGNPQVFYMGATGGGVWKTDNGGQTWKNVSDGYFGGSIGAVAVSPSNPDVVYVGQGEQTVRGNVSSGFEGFGSLPMVVSLGLILVYKMPCMWVELWYTQPILT